MERNKAFVLATITTMLCAATALGQDEYRSAATGNWSALATWEIDNGGGSWATPTMGQGVPGDEDDVTIRNHTVTLDLADPRPDSLLIEANGTLKFDQADVDREFSVEDPDGLTVNAGGIFEVSEDTTNSPPRSRALVFDVATSTPHHSINGQLQLVGSKSFLDVKADVTLNAGASGDRAVVLQDASSAVRIEENDTFTVGANLTLRGVGTIARLSGTNDAILTNDGTVRASGGTLAVASDVAPSGSGTWDANDASASLTFGELFTCNAMSANFTISNGGGMSFATGTSTTLGSFTCTNGGALSGGTLKYDVQDGCTGGSTAIGCDA